jgi:hypothetical protein
VDLKRRKNYKLGKRDECQTPGYGIEPILPWLEELEIEYIWEPAEADGYLSSALRYYGFSVTSTGLPDQDFLEYKPDFEFDCIVTNPPFSIKHLFVERCMELGKPWFLLMALEAIGTHRIQKLMDYSIARQPDLGLIIPTKRINFKMPNKGWKGAGSQFPTAWYCYGSFIGIEIFDASHWTKEYRESFEI